MSGPVINTTQEQEDALISALRRGDADARDELAALLRPLVEAIAAWYAWPSPTGHDLSQRDLIAAGGRGVEKALRHYRAGGDFKFSAYATWWIRAEVHRRLGLPID